MTGYIQVRERERIRKIRERERKQRRKRFILQSLVTMAVFALFFLVWQRVVYSQNQEKLAIPPQKIEGRNIKIKNLADEVTKGAIPTWYQTDARWAEVNYGGDAMEITGCGPVCLSMVVCGLSGKAEWSPPAVAQYAQEEGYYVPGSGSAWALMTEGAAALGLQAREIPLDESRIREELEAKHPIICIMGPGDFTTEGHYLVLTGENEKGEIFLHDPNSEENTEKTWDLQRLMGQMKNLWSYGI